MATKAQILDVLNTAGQPLPMSDLARKVGTQSKNIAHHVDRWIESGLINKSDTKELTITETGKVELVKLRGGFAGVLPLEELPEPPTDDKKEALPDGKDTTPAPLTEISAGTTDQQVFIKYGQDIGISPQTVNLVANHIWRGGAPTDLEWVWQGLLQMGIRIDIAPRWWHAWRSYLQQPIPPSVKNEIDKMTAQSGVKAEAEGKTTKSAEKPVLTHIIKDNLPVYVGEGYGDMTYDDAKKLCEMRTAAIGRGAGGNTGAPTTVGSYADEFGKIIESVRKLDSGGGKGKSYLINRTEGGETVVTEMEGDKPVVVPEQRPPPAQPGKSFLVQEDGIMQELESGKPIVIIKQPAAPPAPASQGKTFIYDRATGKLEEAEAGKPIVIYQQPPAPAAGNPVIPFMSPDGKPFTLDLTTYFKLEEHKAKMEADKESHDLKVGLGKEVKDLISKAVKAFANMGEE